MKTIELAFMRLGGWPNPSDGYVFLMSPDLIVNEFHPENQKLIRDTFNDRCTIDFKGVYFNECDSMNVLVYTVNIDRTTDFNRAKIKCSENWEKICKAMERFEKFSSSNTEFSFNWEDFDLFSTQKDLLKRYHDEKNYYLEE